MGESERENGWLEGKIVIFRQSRYAAQDVTKEIKLFLEKIFRYYHCLTIFSFVQFYTGCVFQVSPYLTKTVGKHFSIGIQINRTSRNPVLKVHVSRAWISLHLKNFCPLTREDKEEEEESVWRQIETKFVFKHFSCDSGDRLSKNV
jgi:hypothetical protein